MKRRWLLVLPLLAALIAGAVWLIVLPEDTPRRASSIANDDTKADLESKANPGQEPAKAVGSEGASTPSQSGPEIIRPQTNQPADVNDPSRPSVPRPGSPLPMGPATSADAQPPAPLTPLQREDQARSNGGNAAHQARMEAAPMGNSWGKSWGRSRDAAGPLKKPLDATKWIEAFAAEGLEPPDMIPTPVAGKIMSQQTRLGIADARVTLISFLPWADKLGGSVYPVATELIADANGELKGDIPAPPRTALNYPALGMVVNALQFDSLTSRQVIAGVSIATVRPGQFNQLGIFWAPETAFDVLCNASARINTGPRPLWVTCTGTLDPQRWHAPKCLEALLLFAAASVTRQVDGVDDPMAGKCLLRGTWNDKDAPFVTLVDGTQPGQTRRCVRNPVPDQRPPPQLPRPFSEVVFDGTANMITGRVVDSDGAPVANAMLETLGDPTPASTLSDTTGWFEFKDCGKAVNNLRASHTDFITSNTPTKAGEVNITVKLPQRKPVLWFMLRDKLTQSAITDVNVKVIEKVEAGKGKAPQPRTALLQQASQSGEYVIKAEFLVAAIVLEKVGYFPRTINDPITLQTNAGGRLDLELNPGRQLDVRPRDYTAVQQTDRWTLDQPATSPGIITYWSNHWIEWQVDFGAELEQGIEGGKFDILLGCTNSGLVDNQYKFEVEVYVDGAKKGNLSIKADSVATQTGRMALGKLSGSHTIRLIWLNDQWIPDQLDANIRYASLKFIEQP